MSSTLTPNEPLRSPFTKKLERLLKRGAAILLGLLLWRPGRRSRGKLRLQAAGKILLVRIDNRVGEALLTTPLFEALAGLPAKPTVDVLVHPKCARVLEEARFVREVIAWQKPRAQVLRRLRRERYDVVVDCGNWSEPSVSSAIVSRLAGPHAAVIGPAVAPLAPLRTHPVEPLVETRSEVRQRLHLLSPLGGASSARMHFRAPRPSEALLRFEATLPPLPRVVVNPGGRLGWRRVPLEVFVAAAELAVSAGYLPMVTWGPGEEELAKTVCARALGARLAPPTSLDELARLMQSAALTVCNNTGPMHLSVAVGTPTFALFLHMDTERWGHSFPPHTLVDLTPEAGDVPRMVQRTCERLAPLLQPRLADGG